MFNLFHSSFILIVLLLFTLQCHIINKRVTYELFWEVVQFSKYRNICPRTAFNPSQVQTKWTHFSSGTYMFLCLHWKLTRTAFMAAVLLAIFTCQVELGFAKYLILWPKIELLWGAGDLGNYWTFKCFTFLFFYHYKLPTPLCIQTKVT